MKKLALGLIGSIFAFNAQAGSIMWWALPSTVNFNIYHGAIPLDGEHVLKMIYMLERPDRGSDFYDMMKGNKFTGNDDWILYSAPILGDGTVNGVVDGAPDAGGKPIARVSGNDMYVGDYQWFAIDYEDGEFYEGMYVAMIALFYDPDLVSPPGPDPYNGYWVTVMGGRIEEDENGDLYLLFSKDLPKPEEAWHMEFFTQIPEPATGLLVALGGAALLLRRRKRG